MFDRGVFVAIGNEFVDGSQQLISEGRAYSLYLEQFIQSFCQFEFEQCFGLEVSAIMHDIIEDIQTAFNCVYVVPLHDVQDVADEHFGGH